LLLRIKYECNDCFSHYVSLHFIHSDIVKNKISEIERKCPYCDGKMNKTITEFKDIKHRISDGNYVFCDIPIITIEENSMAINIRNLLDAGYGGILQIRWKTRTSKYLIDPIQHRIKKIS